MNCLSCYECGKRNCNISHEHKGMIVYFCSKGCRILHHLKDMKNKKKV